MSRLWLSWATVVSIGLLPLVVSHQAPSLGYVGLFVAGLFALLFLPGLLLVRLLRLELDAAELALLGLSLGIVSSAAAYRGAAALSARPLALFWPAAALLLLLLMRARQVRPTAESRDGVRWHLALLVLLLGVVVPMAFMPHFASDFVARADGSLQIGHPERIQDALLHMSVASELTHSIPPEVPFLAGSRLNYHYGIDLLTAMFHDATGIPVRELCLRYLPTLYLSLLVLSAFCFARRWIGSYGGGLLTAVLVVLGEDFSYVPGLVWASPREWIVRFFGVPTLFSLYWVNPMSLALAFLFSGLFCLLRGYHDERRRAVWILLAGVHFAVMGVLKIFLVVQLVAALLILAALDFKSFRERWLKPSAVILASVLVVAAPVLLRQEEAPVIEMSLDPFSPTLPASLRALNLSEVPPFGAVLEMFRSKEPDLTAFAATLLVALPLFVVGSFGTRVVGIPAMVRSLGSSRVTRPVAALMTLFVAVGCALTLCLRVTPIDFPDGYDNSVWFFVQSKYVASLFAGRAVAQWSRRVRPLLAGAGTAAVVLLSVPSSVQFFAQASRVAPSGILSVPAQRVSDFLRREAPPGSVVLSRDEEIRMSVLAETPCRVPYQSIYVASFMRERGLRERVRDLQAFWQAWDEGRIQQEIASKYEVEYVVSRRRFEGAVPSFEGGGYYVYRLGFRAHRTR